MQLIIAYLKVQVLPDNKEQAYELRMRYAHFGFLGDVFYKRGFSFPSSNVLEENKQPIFFAKFMRGSMVTMREGLGWHERH